MAEFGRIEEEQSINIGMIEIVDFHDIAALACPFGFLWPTRVFLIYRQNFRHCISAHGCVHCDALPQPAGSLLEGSYKILHVEIQSCPNMLPFYAAHISSVMPDLTPAGVNKPLQVKLHNGTLALSNPIHEGPLNEETCMPPLFLSPIAMPIGNG